MAGGNAVKIELGASGYRIACGDDHSDIHDLGEPIEWSAPNGKRYIAFCDLPEGETEADSVESQFEHYVYEAKAVATEDSDVVEVEFGGDDEDEDEDGDTGEEDDGGGISTK